MNTRTIHKHPSTSDIVPQFQISTMVSPVSAAGESPAQKDVTKGISSVFERKAQGHILPRFSELKKTIWKDSMAQSWAQVLDALKEKAKQMESLGPKVRNSIKRSHVCAKAVILQAIPRIHYDELHQGLSDEQIAEIKEAGVVIVRGAVSKEVCC